MGYTASTLVCQRQLTGYGTAHAKLQKEVLHELEVEISDMPLLYAEGQKAAAGQDSIYYELVQVFLNNIRM